MAAALAAVVQSASPLEGAVTDRHNGPPCGLVCLTFSIVGLEPEDMYDHAVLADFATAQFTAEPDWWTSGLPVRNHRLTAVTGDAFDVETGEWVVPTDGNYLIWATIVFEVRSVAAGPVSGRCSLIWMTPVQSGRRIFGMSGQEYLTRVVHQPMTVFITGTLLTDRLTAGQRIRPELHCSSLEGDVESRVQENSLYTGIRLGRVT
jgi:hypothetical protein